MKALRDSIQNVEEVKRGSNVNEDQTEQRNYDNAVTSAQGAINNNSNPVLDKNTIEGLTQTVHNTKDALHGANKLSRDQQTAENEIRGLPNLNKPQKDAEIAKVKAASTRNEVSNILQGAKTLDTAMHGLRESINDKSEIKIIVSI